ncbi:endoplasmic reticulum aminopeptidase 1 isoform 1-T2 [Discoglossus pictus]
MAIDTEKLIVNPNSLFYLVTILLIYTTTSASVSSEDINSASIQFPWKDIRLPGHILPLEYDLLIHPNLTTLTFIGVAKITVTITKQTNFVILHSKNLEITKTKIERKMGSSLVHQDLLLLQQPANEQIALQSADPLVVGKNYTLYIEYNANLSSSFRGFYKSTYKTQDGEERVLASTQFEPTAARMAFPCFDEPAFKASFLIKIRREPRHHALSNMPIVKSVIMEGGLIEDHFDVSVKMSTYLVAFIVSDFKSVSQVTTRGIKISVYTVPDKIEQAKYALDAAVKLLDFYEDYFSIPYPLPKQDLAAIPDFQSGAMENWGLTTYRESALLYDPKTSSASSKLWVTMVVAHELAHQWFGNLVTMQWWNDLWLNEGFAKFMEYISVSVTHPELQVEDYFLNKCFDAMEGDSLNSSHAVSTPVENPAEIQEMFDEVSYEKGACILNMLRDYMSAESFKAGIVKYLLRYSYRNAKNEDLWNSMTDVCPSETGGQNENGFCKTNKQTTHWSEGNIIDVKAMMHTWTLQKGFPLVTVTVKNKYVHLKQEHYLKGSSEPSRLLWHIPLTYITSKSDSVQRFLLKGKKDVIVLAEEVDWIKFNVGMNGYYIVHYEGEGWDSLIKLLKENHTAIGSNDRANLINNAFQLVSIGRLPIDKALSLTLYLKHEDKIMPVFQGMHELIPMYKLMEKRDMKDLENKMKVYIINVFRNLIDSQTWDNNGTVSERMIRSHLLLFACVRKYQPCVKKAEKLFKEWQDSNGTISLPSDVATAVYSMGAQTPEGFDFLFSKYITIQTTSVKHQIETALTLTPDKQKLQWLMEEGLRGDHIKTQDLPHIVATISRNQFGYKLTWDFFKKNWEEFVQKFELGSRTISDMLIAIVKDYSSREQLKEVTDFFDLKKDASQLRCIQQAKEMIEQNIEWMDKNLDLVKDWLNKNS